MKRSFFVVRYVRIAGLLATAIAGPMLVGTTASADDGVRSAAAIRPRVVAQFGLDNLLGAGKDMAVKTALSTFGKSLGTQLPIVVDANDAYPTVATLPGAPFAPSRTSANLAVPLRASHDGTIALPPGDYAFPVSVFCMRARSGSPNGHRYLVAPLHGSAADIVTALDSRIPSYAIDHHVVQVLSWDIQAGMAYGAMQSPQRAAVDKIIPDYRSRLGGDVYERIRDQYANVTRNVPGMPSFEDALTRVGPVGAQVVALQSLREQLAQPPPTFAELARALVPFVPAPQARAVSDRGGDTPWSRYSDRVFVRFVTDGNYATPGTYQVRVLGPGASAMSGGDASASHAPSVSFAAYRVPGAAAPRVAAISAAAVPFANIVHNPGTDAVQPLTETPLGGGVPPSPPSCNPGTIDSETVAALPPDRKRTTVGVGETVRLTLADCRVTWTIETVKDGTVESFGSTVTYTAASEAAHETITAHAPHADVKIAFDVIAPDGIFDRQAPCTEAFHLYDRADTGMLLLSYVTPDSVSFQNILVRELDVKTATATGVFAYLAGDGHQIGDNTNVFSDLQRPGVGAPVSEKVVPGRGSFVARDDLVYALGEGIFPPYAPGVVVWKIPMQYKVRQANAGSAAGAAWHPFANNYVAVQTHALAADGKTLTTTKAGASIVQHVSDPSTDNPSASVVARQEALINACPERP